MDGVHPNSASPTYPTDSPSDHWFRHQVRKCCNMPIVDWDQLTKMHSAASPEIPPGSMFDCFRPTSSTNVGDSPALPTSTTSAMACEATQELDAQNPGNFTDIFTDLFNNTIIPIHCAVRTIGLQADKTRLRHVTSERNVMTDSGANVCMTGDTNGLVNIRTIKPLALNLALADGQPTTHPPYTEMGYLPTTRTDGAKHL